MMRPFPTKPSWSDAHGSDRNRSRFQGLRTTAVLLLALVPMITHASHIVGGEFEMLHLSGFTYRINMIIYFDSLHGNEGARDLEAVVRIFRKSDNAFMADVTLPLVSDQPVSYTQPECSHGELVTRKLTYTATVVLSADLYSDPGGYYIAWERCCRNYTITNIYSEAPQQFDPNDPYAAGQTFYLEFPPVVKNGQPFVDSSPHLFPPLNDYACPYHPYYTNFAGVDDDGDSLSYSLVDPLNTTTSEALPAGGPAPAPYPTVHWRPGFSLQHVMQGSPDLKISGEGLLTVTPTIQGLFVFAVKCEEFRDGQKIGEVRRDFQMLVVDACSDAEPPQILGKKAGDTEFSYDDNMNVTFAAGLSDPQRCVQVQVSDPDASKPQDNFMENIKLRAIPIGFNTDVSNILPETTEVTLVNGSVATFDICFPECPIEGKAPYTVGIIAADDACSLPLLDTLKITVNVQPPPDNPAYFTTAKQVSATLHEGDSQQWTMEAKDDEGENIDVKIFPVGFKLEDAGMTFDTLSQNPGDVTTRLTWEAHCDIYDFTHQTNFKLMVLADDQDTCNLNNPDTTYFNLNVILPTNAAPVIDTDLTPDTAETVVNNITRHVFEDLSFNVSATDADNDYVTIRLEGVGFDPGSYDIQFPTASGIGKVSSPFHWNIGCLKENPAARQDFTMRFIAVDSVNKCRFYKTDTVLVKVKVLPADNTAPVLTITSEGPDALKNNALNAVTGDPIHLTFVGTDTDVNPEDLIRIEMVSDTGNVTPQGYSFEPVEGHRHIETEFTWTPDCSIFQGDNYENNYHFVFRIFDDRCSNPKADTVAIDLNIKDIEGDLKNFRPMNFVSPNGDGCNDYFAVEGFDPGSSTCPVDPNYVPLPPDNCRRHFVSVTVVDRWGKQMYYSKERAFRWYPNGAPSGVYYYSIRYTDQTYKGTVTVRY